MNNLIKKLVFTVVMPLAMLSACKKDFLDQKTLAIVNETTVFADSALSLQFVNARYTNTNYSWQPLSLGGSVGLQAAADEGYTAQASTAYLIASLKVGGLNPSNVYSGTNNTNKWAITYQQVRACNIFLKNENSIPVTNATKKRWEGEIRFLRAWYLFTLFKHHGGIPIVRDSIFNGERIDIARSNYENTVNYIAAECDAAAAILPLRYTDINDVNYDPNSYGRVTKGAALALKSRLLLYAASPLANDGTRSDDANHMVSYANADPTRWQKAAEAAQAVINLNIYSLYRNNNTPSFFYNTFQQRAINSEQIFFYNRGNNTFLEVSCAWNPPSRGGGSIFSATQEIVDAFGMANGKAITDPTSAYPGVGPNMYLNRDPRFYQTISYNGSSRHMTGYPNAKVWTYVGVQMPGSTPDITSVSTDKFNAGTVTGYYVYKMLLNEGVTGGSQSARSDVLIRYAEILLNAAEATNEFSGPVTQVYTWLKDIRNRAGITAGADGMYGLKTGMTKEEMRKIIQNERQVELAFEEHRYWDIRRWKIAPDVMNKEMHGMQVVRNSDGSFNFNVVTLDKLNFLSPRNYYWPIPQNEITRSPSIIQNPGY